ncbi:hypothetical protein ACIG87_24420 [Micromonospora sp. NPDC051925]|uniref:hypothetical protein n=1 Tax=Micromonospora sp. NPDC051925 TaxID=3364288 RepID=UPI0037C9F3FD
MSTGPTYPLGRDIDSPRNGRVRSREYLTSGVGDTCYPHLIVQYDQGLRVRANDLDVVAPFPNRLIYVNDPANSAMLLTDDLGDRLSRLLEYEEFGLADGHLGLGYDLALQCVDRRAWPPTRLADLRGTVARLLPGAADEFFAAERLHGGDRLERGCSVLVVVAGAGRSVGAQDDLSLRRGDTLLVPYAAGPVLLTGEVEVIRLSASA